MTHRDETTGAGPTGAGTGRPPSAHARAHVHGHAQAHAHAHGRSRGAVGEHRPAGDPEAHARLLDLDARLHADGAAALLDAVAAHLDAPVRAVVDLGAGTGRGAAALAARFPTAHVAAVDRDAAMLARTAASAAEAGVGDRVVPVAADLDAPGGPAAAAAAVGTPDLVHVALALHEVADPARLLREVHDVLRPGGLLVVVEPDGPPDVLPDGVGPAGLGARLRAATVDAGWAAHPDWHDAIVAAGLEPLDQRPWPLVREPADALVGRYAHAWLGHVRDALGDRLEDADRAALDHLLAVADPSRGPAPDGSAGPSVLEHRDDLVLRTSRTAWTARRP
ncbi:class I SAM-dependent methyltransferase [Cellulomonas endophytica]|uniref:class I SAM-dependent methyltransferase n=1 Tax=Cellulomonas endophytica TaxID=2494735 RepID=UPI0010109C13|nr:methyltransferase domain-containing protein [Cellulomonas endophytica]